ncbi:MAG TPA: HAMP domain-containing sensor histidine kinase [Caulobacteraceae bacterium]|nr:HAMP domain-containing sensor histidine kinase [Caulobacteraceae bacterium]
MRLSELWRTTTARLTLLYGLVFALGVPVLLGAVYLQSSIYLTQRIDIVLQAAADTLERVPRPELPRRIEEAEAINGSLAVFGLFSADGRWLAGNLTALPAGLPDDNKPKELPLTPRARTLRITVRSLPGGETLVVGRDINQLREMRAIIASASLWSGVTILVAGLGCGVALSIAPLRRLRSMQAAAQDIAAGNLKRRMPISRSGDELDVFADAVNYMMSEVERLMNEIKGATETIAHDLRTPLTRARAQLHRLQQAPEIGAADISRVVGEIDTVLERFRALLRISELEARERRAGFSRVDLSDIARQAVDLYQPLAESQGVNLSLGPLRGVMVEADPKLLFEAVSNLVDNAIKFSGASRGPGGRVVVSLGPDERPAQIVIDDNGPGIAEGERLAVLQRFYRSEDKRLIPGSGLGLSIVAAIVRLHRFELALQDLPVGLRAVIDCTDPTEGLAELPPER